MSRNKKAGHPTKTVPWNNLLDYSEYKNSEAYIFYYNRLKELGMIAFEWVNLPITVDPVFLEEQLFGKGMCVFYREDVLNSFVAMAVRVSSPINVYNNPVPKEAYGANGYSYRLTGDNSVLIYNNYLKQPSVSSIEYYAAKLALIDRIIDVNVNAQKTPILIEGTESQRQTLINLYMKYDGNVPFVFGDKDFQLDESLKAIKTDAPFLADKLYELKTQTWNEALTYLGIANVSSTKKERMVVDEVVRGQGGVLASRFSRLEIRKKACAEINYKFGLEPPLDVRYRLDNTGDEEKRDSESEEDNISESLHDTN